MIPFLRGLLAGIVAIAAAVALGTMLGPWALLPVIPLSYAVGTLANQWLKPPWVDDRPPWMDE